MDVFRETEEELEGDEQPMPVGLNSSILSPCLSALLPHTVDLMTLLLSPFAGREAGLLSSLCFV